MISGRFFPESAGGSQKQCLRLSKELIKKGYSITILTSRNKVKTPKNSIIADIRIVRFLTFGPPQHLSLRYLYASLIWIGKIYFWMRRNHTDFDIIHSQQGKFQAYVSVKIAKIFNKKSIVQVVNGGKDFEPIILKKKLAGGKKAYQYIIKNADRFIAASDQMKFDFEKIRIPPFKVKLIKTGINTHSERINYLEKLGDIKFIFVGRFEHQKNLFALIEAFEIFIRKYRNSKLILIGDGSLKQKIRSLVAKKALAEKVECLGWLKDVDVQNCLIRSDFFILPSHAEGMSNALLEAMNVGLIPICTQVSGARDLIGYNQNGFLINGFEPKGIFMAMDEAMRLSQKQKLVMSQRCVDKIEQEHKIEKMAEKFTDLYDSL